ncbi:hypothetical protein [Heyndrickxia acidicola]|uniref:Uncharacterized protein n=1 Tax=Heyndrickxia acidicola TaxID=209389 RepID=A0ABU6MGE4_9BACI|nr:hypothetical protein [Heyndrickxia acidicola]MED1202738.1 hypothetical protein [Heyndrickxia acidicola]
MLQLELVANKKSELVPCSDRVRQENENRVDSSTNELSQLIFTWSGTKGCDNLTAILKFG